MVSERLINCPPQLSPPLQQALYDEIQWATEDQPTQARLKSLFAGLQAAWHIAIAHWTLIAAGAARLVQV